MHNNQPNLRVFDEQAANESSVSSLAVDCSCLIGLFLLLIPVSTPASTAPKCFPDPHTLSTFSDHRHELVVTLSRSKKRTESDCMSLPCAQGPTRPI